MSDLDDTYRRTLRGFGEMEVDDPEALERAEAAVRGESPGVPRTKRAGAVERLPHWRALLRWPESEEVRHRSMALVGLGSNLGDRARAVAEALRRIDALPDTTVAVVSHLYESEPWGAPDQPSYMNAVAAVATALRADQLLDECQRIEKELGRVRDKTRWGPRTIDIDILLFDDEEWESPRLKIPHPRLREREFVVVPLLEIAPEAALPDGSPVRREDAVCGRVTSVSGPVPGFERLTPQLPDEAPSPLRFEELPEQGAAPPRAASGAPDEWVAIASFGQHDVNRVLLVGILENAGIPVIIDPPPTVLPLQVSVRVLVPADREADAQRALVEARAAGRMLEQFDDGSADA